MLQSLREETEGKLRLLLSHRKNGLTSLFKEVRVFKVLASMTKVSVAPALRPRVCRCPHHHISFVEALSLSLSGHQCSCKQFHWLTFSALLHCNDAVGRDAAYLL